MKPATVTHRDRILTAVIEILGHLGNGGDADDLVRRTLATLHDQMDATWLVYRLPGSEWQIWQGESHAVPSQDWLAEALDSEETIERNGWWLQPVQTAAPATILVAHPRRPGALDPRLMQIVGATLRAGLQGLARATPDRQRLERLTAILQIVRRWSEHRDTEQMLVDLAESATQLLDAERASIFLWDRPRGQLVARPALGVTGNELRIPDNRGVVGTVVHEGEPRRVDAEAPQEIDRVVDQQLGFVTRNLLCVPLHTPARECLGAFELINKRMGNFTAVDLEALTELAHHAAVALATAQDRDRLFQSRRQIAEQAAEKVKLIGNSPALESLRATVRRVADTDLALLILGENGTGKEVISQMVHYLSRRRTEPLIAVNCAALTETLLESELFGHEKGAFTDAHEARPGKFELAARGTLFLDEIGDLSLSGQAKLLRVLEEKIVVRVGGSIPIPTDARVIAATNQDLAKLVRAGKFREDLFFRLNVVTLRIPPLRDRPEDIPLLAEYFLHTFARQARRSPPQFSPAALRRLMHHSWPGNVRELRNLMERLAYLSSRDVIEAEEVDFVASPTQGLTRGPAMGLGLTEATQQFQVDYIRRHVQSARGNLSLAADRLGLHRSNLYRKMKQLGMATDEAESGDSDPEGT